MAPNPDVLLILWISSNDEDDRTICQVMDEGHSLIKILKHCLPMWTKVFIYLIFNYTLSKIL